MSVVELQPAFVLHRRPFRNTSLILDLLTLNHGRVALVARGARGGKKNTSAQLQAFRHLLISWRGKGEMYSMTGVEDVHTPGGAFTFGQTSLLCAYYVNELAMKLLPRDDPHPEVFAVYNDTLKRLSEFDADIEPALRRYEISLLASLGYQLVVDHDVVSGESIDPQKSYKYSPDRGPSVVNAESNEFSIPVSGATLKALADDNYSSSVTLKESRYLLRALIDRQLDGRPLKSREMFVAMKTDISGAIGPAG